MIKRPIAIMDAAGNNLTASLVIDVPDHIGWNWAYKFNAATPGTRFIGLEYRDFMQGMLVVDITPHPCLSPSNHGSHGIYVSYLAAAPWNIGRFMKGIDRKPVLDGIGPALMKTAINISRFVGCEGRIVLHSVPKSEFFYRNHCNMEDLGIEFFKGENLRRFEISKDAVDQYMRRG